MIQKTLCFVWILSAVLAAGAETVTAGLRPGLFSQAVKPAGDVPPDNRLEIDIPNLLVNGYFREGGNALPPRGWVGSAMEGCGYGKGLHAGRTFQLRGKGARFLRQNGIVMVPGEKYRVSGYIRGENFKGDGHIGIACDNWSKIRAYFFSGKDIQPDWQYFEVVFTPDVSKAGEYEMIVYRKSETDGSIEVDHLILEPLSKKGLQESRNKFHGNKFDENYAKALTEGKLRSGPPSGEYRLVWSDEFNGKTPDESKWKVYDMSAYRDTRGYVLTPDCVRLDGEGHLIMTTRLGKDGRTVESPRISSTGHYTFVRGYLEARIELHDSPLANCSFWLLPEGRMDANDPVNKGMEIDIMECVNPALGMLSHTTHWYSTDPKTGKRVSFSGGTCARRVPGLDKGFHSLGFEWTDTDYVFFIDGVESWRLNKKDHPVTVKPHNIIFSFGGRVGEIRKQPAFVTNYRVDYIRLYQKEK
ncbi:MAG: Beta-glucanase precursor [Lentisphaerae bacterium ADurb.Bin242]|nr:MAG: Beta-glucanase precursor [Lentisphaerae bacterium ADurb.Bin242]